jgi:hypothetical protein
VGSGAVDAPSFGAGEVALSEGIDGVESGVVIEVSVLVQPRC